MPPIQTTLNELRSRGEQIRNLMRPVAKLAHGPAWEIRPTQYRFLIGMHDGSPPGSHPRYWRFATFVPDVRAAYYEVWTPVDEEYWCLTKAYLNMFRTNRVTREERKLLSLHCDPNEPDNAPHAVYKRGPHMHIQAADDPFPHAHIALTGAYLELVLCSVDSLSEAMEWAVLMLKEEILEAI